MSKIYFSEEFYKREFQASTMKQAYLEAVKWYATNILSKKEFEKVHVEFIKGIDEDKLPTVTVHLYSVLDGTQDVFKQHCNLCKEMHKSFFINEANNCNSCNAQGYQNRMLEKAKTKRKYYLEMLGRYIKLK